MLNKLLSKMLLRAAQAALPLGGLATPLARALFTASLTFDPAQKEALAWRHLLDGSAARRKGDAQEAVRLLREASAVLPNNDVLIANLGIALAMSGHHDEAIGTIERAIRGELDVTGEPQIWMALSWSYLRSGRAPKAVDACDRAEECQASGVECKVLRLLARGVIHGFIQRDRLNQLIRLRPSVMPLVLDFVQYQLDAADHDLARQVLRCLPESAQAKSFNVVARSAFNSGSYDTAMWALKQYEISDPASPAPSIMRAEISLRRGDTRAALAHAQRAVHRDAKSPDAHAKLARTLLARDDWPAAVATANEALSRKSGDALVAGIVAVDRLGRGEVEQARRIFTVQRAGDDLACIWGHAAQARILATAGKPDQALDMIEQGHFHLKQLPDWARLHGLLDRPASMMSETVGGISAGHDQASHRAGDLARGLAATLAAMPDQDPEGPEHSSS